MTHAFSPARLVSRTDAGGGLTRLTLELPAEVAASYTAPGQYIEMRSRGETGYFVVSSDPGGARWELVMRAGGGVSDVVLTMPAGGDVEVTGALGHGFPMVAARGRPLIVALAGTGVAAGPPVVRRRVRDGDARATQVLLGIRDETELPMAVELGAWTGAGVDLTVAVSGKEPGPAAPGLRLLRGRVQDALRDRLSPRAPRDASVFVVGGPAMIDETKDLAVSLGIAADRVHANH